MEKRKINLWRKGKSKERKCRKERIGMKKREKGITKENEHTTMEDGGKG